ncbi:MAG: HIT family protein [Nitrospirae bacterium]|nr:HIT family protein [Nitrospirota bacterium]MBI3594776.1 HIT family protein [Nitrospirota bacterium]
MTHPEIQVPGCSICRHLKRKSPFEIIAFSDSVLYLNKDQFFKGYCFLEYKSHVKELFDLAEEPRNLYTKHLSLAARALHRAFRPDKINYELLGNKVPHLHWHIVPRFKNDPAWSDTVWSKPHDPLHLPEPEIVQVILKIRNNI